MTVNLSQYTKFGQTVYYPAGSAAINPKDLIEIGGPGNEAYTANTTDYATTQGSILSSEYNFGLKSMPGNQRQSAVRDSIGNLYILNLNSSGNLVVTKFSSLGYLITSAALDAVTTSAFTAKVFALTNGTFATVYARASGLIYFVIFDSSLKIISGPTEIDAEYTSGNSVYHSSTALAGGGFAVVSQTLSGSQVNLYTFSNSGAVVQSGTEILSLGGSAAQMALKVAQLPNGNLLVAVRGMMTPAGTSFLIVNTAGGIVKTDTLVDSTSTFGLVEIDIIAATGTFAVAAQNGTNIIASVYSQAGILQGTKYSTADTLNVSTAIQFALCDDQYQFWLCYIGSANAGVNVIQIPATGTNQVLTSAFGSSSILSTFSIDARVINGLLTIFAADSSTGGQYWMTIGLPDPSISVGVPYTRTAPVAFGTSAATTGSYWPIIINVGDWIAIFIYDRQNVSGVYFGIQRLESSRIVGVAQNPIAAGNQGSLVETNVGPGSYVCNPLIGAPGVSFNQGTNAPFGNIGTLFNNGVIMQGIPSVGVAPPSGTAALTGTFGSGQFQIFFANGSFTVPAPFVRARAVGGGQGGGGGSPGSGGTSSFGTLISATGGSGSGGGAGTGGQFQASGGAGGGAGIGDSSNGCGGGGGGAGSLAGNGGAGGAGSGTTALCGGGGGGCPGKGSAGTTVPGAGGGAFDAIGPNGGANAVGTSAVPAQNTFSGTLTVASPGVYPYNLPITSTAVPHLVGGGPGVSFYVFPFFQMGGGGGSAYGGLGAPGGGGGGQAGIGGDGAGGGGTGASGTGIGGQGSFGGGGGGGNVTTTGGKGGNGGGFAIGVFGVPLGSIITVTVGAGGTAGTDGGKGGPGICIVEW